jgi:hypothetical protein
MIMPSEEYPSFPRELYSDSQLIGDLCSEGFKYYCVLVGGVSFGGMAILAAI